MGSGVGGYVPSCPKKVGDASEHWRASPWSGYEFSLQTTSQMGAPPEAALDVHKCFVEAAATSGVPDGLAHQPGNFWNLTRA